MVHFKEFKIKALPMRKQHSLPVVMFSSMEMLVCVHLCLDFPDFRAKPQPAALSLSKKNVLNLLPLAPTSTLRDSLLRRLLGQLLIMWLLWLAVTMVMWSGALAT